MPFKSDDPNDFTADKLQGVKEHLDSKVEAGAFIETCQACRGSGQFYSYTGRLVGPCFKCNGKGSKAFKTSADTRRKARESSAKRKEDTAQAFRSSELGQFLEANQWSDFARSLFEGGQKYGGLTEKQEAAAYRMKAKVEAREADKAREREALPSSGVDLSELVGGLYAVPGDESRLKVRVEHGKEGTKWEGWTFVKDGAVYGGGQRYGTQRPDGDYQGKIVDQLKAILDDPFEAMCEYGRITSTCGACGRPLEDEESVARGIGPVCATKF